jgi:hypothetical protein
MTTLPLTPQREMMFDARGWPGLVNLSSAVAQGLGIRRDRHADVVGI